jgi:hypothetical protein
MDSKQPVSFILRKVFHYFLCLSSTKHNSLVLPLFQLLAEKLSMYKRISMLLDFRMLFILHESKHSTSTKHSTASKSELNQKSQTTAQSRTFKMQLNLAVFLSAMLFSVAVVGHPAGSSLVAITSLPTHHNHNGTHTRTRTEMHTRTHEHSGEHTNTRTFTHTGAHEHSKTRTHTVTAAATTLD